MITEDKWKGFVDLFFAFDVVDNRRARSNPAFGGANNVFTDK
ncbi:MAG TPA: hypothetical protein VK582_13340 [Pyrinomonadaceae bacterium]|nr:hypothetical protein [Pyrinomonadaceae bacterium]